MQSRNAGNQVYKVDVETAMGCKVSSELVAEVFSWVLKDWEVLFTLFLLAGKQPDYAQSLREHHSMIAIIGKMRKLDTASTLVDEMRERRVRRPCSCDTRLS
ncbi:hypothetical protein Goarm_017238 [Gossypium armourianum]|uniref:Pentatricopeptide repeat-containing protein n=1 Tax=Gossypium armourianum TaxID=34283 RepID=A0A7J9JEP3_9ROSI|nr:hypothetical protein [Gossypium armourianum]